MGTDGNLTRKQFMGALIAAAVAPAAAVAAQSDTTEAKTDQDTIGLEDLAVGEKLAALSFDENHRKLALSGVRNNVKGFAAVRNLDMRNEVEPQLVFTPTGRQPRPSTKTSLKTTPVKEVKATSDEDIAFLNVRELGYLIRTKKISPVELTEIYLKRLETHGGKLNCVITLTPELARKQAKQAESEIMAGRNRGPLHGIPYGIKDLFAVKGYRTTWGAEAFQDQMIDHDCAVVEKLTAAGAVCLAKLSCGALANNDTWFGGQTKNPWNPKQGSSGSSAGSACSTAAGFVGFSIGTETLGSIISPSNRCRVTGLRPTYGRVSRYGGMVLTWTMDKVGPICRSAEDCAIVLAAIHGSDPRDLAAVDRPYEFNSRVNFSKLKIGVIARDNEDPIGTADWAKELTKMGAKLQPVKFSAPPEGLGSLLVAEGAAFFDKLTRSEGIDKVGKLWPSEFLTARYLPAVEYINAHRARTLMCRKFEEELGDLDLVVTDHFWDSVFTICNSTGHPQVIIPWGLNAQGGPRSVSVVGRLYGEPLIAAVANLIQQTRDFHLKRPDPSAW